MIFLFHCQENENASTSCSVVVESVSCRFLIQGTEHEVIIWWQVRTTEYAGSRYAKYLLILRRRSWPSCQLEAEFWRWQVQPLLSFSTSWLPVRPWSLSIRWRMTEKFSRYMIYIKNSLKDENRWRWNPLEDECDWRKHLYRSNH